jgi:hypothetical protein
MRRQSEVTRISTDRSALHPTAEHLPATSRRQRRPLPFRGTRRSRLGTYVGMTGAALIAIGTFLPWLELNGSVRSGWAIFRLTGVLGSNPAVISPMFGGGGADVFFTGLVTLALGILSLLLMAGVLIAHRTGPPQRVKEGMGLVVSATLAIAAALVVTTVNLRTARLGTQGFDGVVHYGLWVTFAGGWAGTLGMVVSITGRRRIVQERWEREPARAAPEVVVSQSRPSAASERSAPAGQSGGGESSGQAGVDGPVRSGSRGQSLTRALAILLFLVGFGGFVVAAASDQSVQKSSAADETTLGQRDPVAAAKTLRTGFTSVNSAFNAYAAASQVVATARQDVTTQFAKVAAVSGRGGAGLAAANRELSGAIAAHGAAVAREQVARQVYVDRLDVLIKEVHP